MFYPIRIVFALPQVQTVYIIFNHQTASSKSVSSAHFSLSVKAKQHTHQIVFVSLVLHFID